jgi:hypothetical protein
VRPRIAIGTCAALVLLAACSSGGSGSSTASGASPAPGPRPSTTATLKILSPTNGQVIHGTTVDLKVSLTGAKLVSVSSTNLVPNEGHLHVSVDDTLVSMTSGLEQTIPNLTPGTHLITVEFVANDHFPFDPRVRALVSFQVKP